MGQIFVFGSSSSHGVGGSQGGWGDLLKQRLHQVMYGPNGIGERHQIYNFAKPGAKIDFVKRTFPAQLNDYRIPGPAMAIVAVGGNNVKAEGTADNFVSTVEQYVIDMTELLATIRAQVDAVVVLGFKPYDEAKAMPKISPLNGKASYFSNARTAIFHSSLCKICDQEGYVLIGVDHPEQWVQTCLCDDGLHPNDVGHQKICNQIWPYVHKFLGLP
jgi:lysophospholipase L1-like esterase